ncbi:MAG: hypothetical protein AAF716_20850 [Cyanobacteria bacterium P01_D01_bin.1]
MIGGIFETIGKTLGVGKEKYFLELDDAAEETAKGIKKSATSATKTAKAAVETAKEATVEVAQKAQELVADTADEAEDKAKETADTAEKAVAKGKKTATKKVAKTVAKGKQAAKEMTEVAEAPAQPTAPSRPSVEDLIANAIAATEPKKQADSNGKVSEEVQNFATDYLMTPSRASRRRPGPSLSPFKDMAKEANPRLKG